MHSIKSGKCRKRKVQTLALLVIIAILYFLLQFFSISRLGSYQTSRNGRTGQDWDLGGQDEQVTVAADTDNGVVAVVPEKKSDQVLKNPDHLPPVPNPRGVHPSHATKYAEDKAGMFRCLDSEIYIPIKRVNDDFCDCPDSSDEPGTSACPAGRFYCQVQLPQREPQFVHSSKVNDGICDCCDGSDEWAGQEVPSVMKLEGKRGAVFHTPCADRCGDIQKLIEDEQRIRQKGLHIQNHYRDAARHLSHREQQSYGPAGVFYLLSQKCYEYSTHEYRYTVCPFQSVKQSSGTLQHTVLGRGATWTQQKPGDFLLTMAQGDASLCPDGQARQVQLRFLCGLEDHVISVQEDQKCRYVIKFSTPAAC